MKTRRTVLKGIGAMGIIATVGTPEHMAAPTVTAPPKWERHGMLIDHMSGELDPNTGGYPIYSVYESSEGMTVARLGGTAVIGVGRGPTLTAAIANVVARDTLPEELQQR